MVYEHEIKDKILKINALGGIYGSNIEDYDGCMSIVMDKLMGNRDIKGLIISTTREHEYDFEETQILVDFATALDDILRVKKLLTNKPLIDAGCAGMLDGEYSQIQEIVMNRMKGDPVGAYVMLTRKVRHVRIKLKSADMKSKKCYQTFLDGIVSPIMDVLGKTRIIQISAPFMPGFKQGDRAVYREIFHPTVRPNFMLTKYQTQAPERGRIIDKYKILGGVEVEIYRSEGQIRDIYHVTPPEFNLSEDHYALLDAARRYMVEHQPRELEFANPERMREVFYNIGRDLLIDLSSQMGIDLKEDDLKELASILTRYTAGLGVMEILLADPKVQDVYINSPIGENPVHIFHQDYEECITNLIPTQDDAESWATRFRLMSGRPLDEANPVLDTETSVPGGRARITIITKSLSAEGLSFALRRHRDSPWTYPLYMQPSIKYMNPLFAGLMSFIVDGSRTFLIAGTRSSGKTSMLSATMLEILRKYRIIVVEDTKELPISEYRKLGFNIESLKSRSVITQVETEMRADDAIRTALRLGDSVLIIGEVRSLEAKALYEAMRVGALANIVAGTIHGDSAYGVYDRLVNDLQVPNTSFKATDFIVNCNLMRSADGLKRFRRVTAITEVRKHWKDDPMDEGGFVPLMEYSSKEDTLKPTPTFLNGESQIINDIASRVREWSGNWEAVWENINLRAKIKQTIMEHALKANKPYLMEAPFIVRTNDIFHIVCEKLRNEVGSIPPERAYNEWLAWFKEEVK